jgi:hypothetical protein
MQERPKIFAPPKDDVGAPAAVSAIRPRHRIVLGAHKMLAACPAMPAPAKYPDLIDKI